MPFLKTEQLTNVFRCVFCLNYVFTLGNFMKPGTGCHNIVCLDQRAFASRFTGHLASILCSSVSSVISKETYITTVLENGLQCWWRMKIGGKNPVLPCCSPYFYLILAPCIDIRISLVQQQKLGWVNSSKAQIKTNFLDEGVSSCKLKNNVCLNFPLIIFLLFLAIFVGEKYSEFIH